MADPFTSAAAAAGGDLLTGWLNNEYAIDRQNQAQDFSARQFATRYQTTVKDMQAAGLNPMLAYSQGGGSPPSGSVASSSATPSIGRSISSAYNADVQRDLIREDTERTRADTDLKVAQTRATESMSRLTDAQVTQVEKSVEKMSSEIRNLDSDNQRILALVDNLKEERQNLIKQGYNLTEQGNMLRASVDKIRVEIPLLRSEQFLKEAQKVLTDAKTMLTIAETGKTSAMTSVISNEAKLKGYDVSAAEKFENFGREYKQYKGIIDLALEIFRPRSGGITINK